MADEVQSLRGINWRELFPFINLFRAFRVAIHPSKLVLGFALLFLVYCGGRTLDALWPMSHAALYHEIDSYEASIWARQRTAPFDQQRERLRENNASAYAAMLLEAGATTAADVPEAAASGRYRGAVASFVITARNDALAKAKKARDDAYKAIESEHGATADNHDLAVTQAREKIAADEAYREAVDTANQTAGLQLAEVNERVLHGPFDTFADYQVRQFHNIIDSTLSTNWIGSAPSAGNGSLPRDAVAPQPTAGVLRSLYNLAFVGPGWMLRYHPLFFLLLGAWFLLMWAIFGGAIARITAIHVARDEKISIRQALRFSSSKLLSFVFAPLIPLGVFLGTGLLIAAGGLLMYIPALGPIVVGALFIIPLLLGLLMTLAAVGTIGGINLMYPTIAVEGSDSFDAISRSFSYVYARPWRMIFYTAISLVYGSLCFLFIRFFVYLTLLFTQYFTQWLLWGQPGEYWPQIWPPVSYLDLTYRISFHSLAWSERIAAFFIALWVYVALAFLGAFVVSFYYSASSIIYYLMRREVDATELDDVYIEEDDEEFAEPATPPTAPPAGALAASGPADET